MNEYSFENMFIGLKESFTVSIRKEMLETFADLCGDHNPLHVDENFAIERNFDHKVVYGMLVASFYSTLVGMWLPGKNALLQEISILFRRPVYVGNVLTVSGTISEVDDRFKRVQLQAEIRNEEMKKVSSAIIYCGLSDGLGGK